LNRTDIIGEIVVGTIEQLTGRTRSEIQADPATLRIIEQYHAGFGGDRYYIPKEAPSVKAELHKVAYTEALTTASTTDIQRRHGLSRSTIYRLVKRGPPGAK
jgi:Mor family transcriptional regulator